uniref:Natural killer cell lectin-like receptor n=1 Tax=Chrysemys picta bellii TaxID=8478 RepID=A0A8C3P4V9_CHRPI
MFKLTLVTNTLWRSRLDKAGSECLLCPPGWVLHERKCYYFSEKKKTWSDSEKYCSSQTSSLAVIDSEEEKVRKQLIHTSNGVKSAIYIYQGEGNKKCIRPLSICPCKNTMEFPTLFERLQD